MAVQDYKINYKSDFVLNINGDAGWAIPFCIKFWTGMPSQAYFVGFDGVKYVNCRVGDTPTQLLVMFDDHHLPIGPLKMQIAYHTTIEEFPGSVFDEVTNARDVIVTIDGTDYQVLLDFTGEDAPELEFNLPAYANEAERIQNELQRQQNEAARIAAELQREQATSAAVQGAENVNAQLNGTTLTVTNRNGVSTSVNTKGERGEQGPVGPEGPQGEQGVSIVDFRPVYASETATYYVITFSDGHEQSVAIPKGAKGDTGATGPTGPQGPQGQTGVSITGFVETGETETDTLYNITFSNGTTQAVAIPKGEKGDRGPAGPTGPQGPMGDVAVITPEQQAAFTMYSEPGQNTNGPMTQKAATDELDERTLIVGNSLNFGSQLKFAINQAGAWVGTATTAKHYAISITAGGYYKVTANSSYDAIIMWLISNAVPSGSSASGNAPLSSIDSSQHKITAGESAIFQAPSDANYMFALSLYSGADRVPSSVVEMVEIKDATQENSENIATLQDVVANSISTQWTKGVIGADGVIGTSDTRLYSGIVESGNKLVEITLDDGYVLRAICYYVNGVFQSRTWPTIPWSVYREAYDGGMRFIISKSDNANIGINEGYLYAHITRLDDVSENTSINDAVEENMCYEIVKPIANENLMVTAAGLVISDVSISRRLLWLFVHKGDTVRVRVQTKQVISTLPCVFYAASQPSTSLTENDRLYYHMNIGVMGFVNTYTAEQDGFMAFTCIDDYIESYEFGISYAASGNFDSTIIPKIGCGTKIVSRLRDTYCHAPMIEETTRYRFICYHGSNVNTQENTNGTTYVVLLVVDKVTGESKYINVFDYAVPDYIDGNKCTLYYNHSIIVLAGTNTLMIRCGCQCNSKWILIYKTYNADTGVLSSAAMQKLSYNGNTYDFNLANYITMVNTLYNKSFTVVQLRVTNEVTSMCYYNNKYYCVMAYFCHDKLAIPARFIKCPHIFAVSDDAITWTPIANVTDDYYSAETLLTIVNDIVYHVFRSDRLGEFYMVFDMTGNILKAPEPANNPLSKVWTKPAICYNGKKVLIGFNKVYNDGVSSDIYSLRTKMCLAEISQTDYSLTEYKTYISANGWNYYYFSAKKNGNVLVVNCEDSRCFNDQLHDVTTDVNICEIDMLEFEG